MTPPVQIVANIKRDEKRQNLTKTQENDFPEAEPFMRMRNETEVMTDKQVQATYGGESSERHTLHVKDSKKNGQTKSEDMSDAPQDETYQLPKKYSVGGSGNKKGDCHATI